MKTAICHYSLHRTYAEQNWTVARLAAYVKDLGVGAIDFHVRFLESPEAAVDQILAALDETGLVLSGLSLSTNFNQEDPADFAEQVETARRWLETAGKIKAPASRVFGGHVKDRTDADLRKASMNKVVEALKELEPVARSNNVVLALENHGGLPCTGQEQAEVLAAVDSEYCRATIDLGNYMQCPQDPLEGVRAALPYCAYVHVKDYKQNGSELKRVTVGQGDVDLFGCLKLIRDGGFDGFVALEYEGEDDELTGVPQSVDYMNRQMARL